MKIFFCVGDLDMSDFHPSLIQINIYGLACRMAWNHYMFNISWDAVILKYITVTLMSRTIAMPVFLLFVFKTC